MNNSRLLSKVCYALRTPNSDTDLVGNKIEVRGAFPYNPESKTSPETAARWAENRRWGDKTPFVPDIVETNNEPFSVTITDLEHRSEGGRSYKVVDEQMRQFDLREDQVLEVMKLVGIGPGGKVPGTFVWGITGSQVKMVLVGGELHCEMVKNTQNLLETAQARSQGKLPTESTLEVGHVYRKRDGNLFAFVGRVTVPGKQKQSFAFVEMPSQPLEVDIDDIYDYDHCTDKQKENYEKFNKIVANWPIMSWEERIEFDIRGRYFGLINQDGKLVESIPFIMITASAKFDGEEAGVVDVSEYRANVNGIYKYIDFKHNDLAEDDWRVNVNHNNPRPWYGNRYCGIDYHLTPAQYEAKRAAAFAAAQKEYIDTRIAWSKSLVWAV